MYTVHIIEEDLGDGGVQNLFQDLDNTPSNLIDGAGMFVMIDPSGKNIEFKPLIDPSDASIVSKNTFSQAKGSMSQDKEVLIMTVYQVNLIIIHLFIKVL